MKGKSEMQINLSQLKIENIVIDQWKHVPHWDWYTLKHEYQKLYLCNARIADENLDAIIEYDLPKSGSNTSERQSESEGSDSEFDFEMHSFRPNFIATKILEPTTVLISMSSSQHLDHLSVSNIGVQVQTLFLNLDFKDVDTIMQLLIKNQLFLE